MKKIVKDDLERIYNGLTDEERKRFSGSTVLLTGGAGFLGFYFIHFLTYYQEELAIEDIICLDNFQMGYPKWLKDLSEEGKVKLHKFNVITDDIADIPGADAADLIYHMASIASPIFYRKYPIETLDANIWGLRRLLDFYCNKQIKGLAFFSSSEIYGIRRLRIFQRLRPTVVMWTVRDREPAMMRRSALGRRCAICSMKNTICRLPLSDRLTIMDPV